MDDNTYFDATTNPDRNQQHYDPGDCDIRADDRDFGPDGTNTATTTRPESPALKAPTYPSAIELEAQLRDCQQRLSATAQEYAELGEFFRTHYGPEIARGHATGERTCDTIMRLLSVERWVARTPVIRWLYRVMDGSEWRR